MTLLAASQRQESDAGSAPRQTRVRLHRSTWLILLLAAAALVLVIVPGENTQHFFYPPVGVSNLQWYHRFEHGWPFVYLQRIHDENPPEPAPHQGVPWLQKQGWRFDCDNFEFHSFYDKTIGWSPGRLALDVAVAIGTLAVIAVALEWRRRCRRVFWQISLAEILGLVFIASLAGGWWAFNKRVIANEARLASVVGYAGSRYQGPTWLSRAVGRDNLEPFYRNYSVSIEKNRAKHLPEVVDQLPFLEAISITGPIEPGTLHHLSKSKRLREIRLTGVKLTDSDLADLAKCARLDNLVGSDVEFSDEEFVKRFAVGGRDDVLQFLTE
jgi:hypothetical protein